MSKAAEKDSFHLKGFRRSLGRTQKLLLFYTLWRVLSLLLKVLIGVYFHGGLVWSRP